MWQSSLSSIALDPITVISDSHTINYFSAYIKLKKINYKKNTYISILRYKIFKLLYATKNDVKKINGGPKKTDFPTASVFA